MNSDFKELLQLLNTCKVKFLVVGGYAVMKYTEPRYTKDIDIWVEPSTANSKRVYEALTQFGAPLANLEPSDLAKPGVCFMMGLPPTRIDILTRIKGVSFPVAWRHRENSDIDGLKVPFISRSDLIKAKRKAGRPQDLLDLSSLTTAPDDEILTSGSALLFDRRKIRKKKGS